MSEEADKFTIAPRPDGHGFHLRGPVWRWPLWYVREEDAANYAQHCGRERGGTLETFDAAGELLRSELIAKY